MKKTRNKGGLSSVETRFLGNMLGRSFLGERDHMTVLLNGSFESNDGVEGGSEDGGLASTRRRRKQQSGAVGLLPAPHKVTIGSQMDDWGIGVQHAQRDRLGVVHECSVAPWH